MPLLWKRVYLWETHEWPPWLSLYPATASKRALSHIRTMTLSVHVDGNDWGVEKFNKLHSYMCGCLRILVHARSIDQLSLFLGAYDPADYPPECIKVIKAVNRTAFRILKFVAKMDLRELWFHPGRETARIEDIMTIIERKVHKLEIHTIPIASWAHRVANLERVTTIELIRIHPRNEEVDGIFWTAISKLPNVTALTVDAVPLSPTLNLQFPQIVNLDLNLWWPITAHEWAYSLEAVFKQFPSLEKLDLLGFGDREFTLATEALHISSVSCRNLRHVHVSSGLPTGLLGILGRDCANLEHCYYGGLNDSVDDEDLLQLSRCENLRSLELRAATRITYGIAYLTNNHKLETFELYYSAAKYINKQLLVDFARSCPSLKIIKISDWNNSMRRYLEPRPFEERDIVDIIPAAVDLRSYIEQIYSRSSKWVPDGLNEYLIHLDKLREDMLKFQQLALRLGHTLVKLCKSQLISFRHRIS
jgi:hypothetical protein